MSYLSEIWIWQEKLCTRPKKIYSQMSNKVSLYTWTNLEFRKLLEGSWLDKHFMRDLREKENWLKTLD